MMGRFHASSAYYVRAVCCHEASSNSLVYYYPIMKSSCILFLVSALFASSEAFVVTSTSAITTTKLSAQTSSRAEFLRDVAATSIASVMVSLPGVAAADDAGDLAMPTEEEQKAIDVSHTIPVDVALQCSYHTNQPLLSTLQVSLEFNSVSI